MAFERCGRQQIAVGTICNYKWVCCDWNLVGNVPVTVNHISGSKDGRTRPSGTMHRLKCYVKQNASNILFFCMYWILRWKSHRRTMAVSARWHPQKPINFLLAYLHKSLSNVLIEFFALFSLAQFHTLFHFTRCRNVRYFYLRNVAPKNSTSQNEEKRSRKFYAILWNNWNASGTQR